MLAKLTTTILLLATTTLAHPQTKRGAPICKSTNLPTESQFELGYRSFCSTYLPPGRKHYIKEGAPLVATFDLSSYTNKPLKWIYKISATDNTPTTLTFEVDEKSCVEMFRGILEGGQDKKMKGGNVAGENYCVVDGTVDGKKMSGEGTVLVMGGWTWVEGLGQMKDGKGWFESRERKG